ncbi:hypothetical protein [Petroclostridium sp. X23]|uniref:hypothetical protein n=1 Tax=Petroclostridium sp. X23 TaxID=3045146 RepID=UPI0024AD05AB|nr:hypothetical protein [Petroclostridium sp. X23]WHH57065.1 hypothetical protein QKW49_14585 [Petroclostridium sp. X23]
MKEILNLIGTCSGRPCVCQKYVNDWRWQTQGLPLQKNGACLAGQEYDGAQGRDND